jgi:3-deoxy-D-manno-octulosonic-acid transferase
VAAQSEADAERFIELGVPAERIEVTGSVKFDMRMPASLQESAEALRNAFGGRPVWVAASTHEGEDPVVLEAHRRIRNSLPQALLILVPRHPDRFERVAELCTKEGFELARRSIRPLPHGEASVFLGDSMGELPLFLAAADAAFVGGSLVKKGGQNVLEPAALGKPVVFGPSMYNFAVISKLLLEQGAAQQVKDGSELGRVIGGWLSDAGERAQVGENGRRVVDQNRGALERLLALVERQL